MTHAKKQHYVPQFLLRRFETEVGSGQLYAYDKQGNQEFPAGMRRIAAEKGFYDLRIGDFTVSFESSLSELEGAAATVIDEIVNRGEIGFLSAEDEEVIASFVVVQFFRTRQFHESSKHLGQLLRESISEMADADADELGMLEPTSEEEKAFTLRQLKNSVQFTPLVLNKEWVLYETTESHALWISDHPVVLHNTLNQSDVRGTIGFAVPGIEIYLPISSQYCLGFLCPTIREKFEELRSKALHVKESFGIELPNHENVGAVCDGFRYGYPIPLDQENVKHFNSLQVLWAERFIFSSENDFDIAKSMIERDPDIRSGPRPKVD